MEQLFEFVGRRLTFILFVLLEVLCFYFIANSSNYWSARYFNTANQYAAQVLTFSNSAREFARLRQVNGELATENKLLRAELTRLRQLKPPAAPVAYRADSVFAARFRFSMAKVINSTTQLPNNYITIDKGTANGLRPGMAVLSPTGIVGKIKFCNEHFSVVTSILNTEFRVSAKLTRSGEIGTGRWEGADPRRIKLNDVSRYTLVRRGDSVVTSDRNSVFPPGILVGRVRSVTARPDQTFHDIDLDLATNFNNLAYVYVVENSLQSQQEQAEAVNNDER
jgi:rod shape-determining protein MreC